MSGFPESDVAQLTHEGNIVTWTLMKNEDGSFTQVILFAPSDGDNLKQIPYINSKAYFRGAGGGICLVSTNLLFLKSGDLITQYIIPG